MELSFYPLHPSYYDIKRKNKNKTHAIFIVSTSVLEMLQKHSINNTCIIYSREKKISFSYVVSYIYQTHIKVHVHSRDGAIYRPYANVLSDKYM